MDTIPISNEDWSALARRLLYFLTEGSWLHLAFHTLFPSLANRSTLCHRLCVKREAMLNRYWKCHLRKRDMNNDDQTVNVKKKLLEGDFDFGTRQYEPRVSVPIDAHAPIKPRLIAYLKSKYGASGKLEHYDESLKRILGLDAEKVRLLLEQDESETAKIYTLCCTLSAARKDWAPLLSEQKKGFISDFPPPRPENKEYALPEPGPHQAINDAQTRYFFSALMTGMPTRDRERYHLLQTEWQGWTQPRSHLSNGMDSLVLQIDRAVQDAFGYFLAKVPGVNDRDSLPDHGAKLAGEQTRELVGQLLPHLFEAEQDLLRAVLLKNGAVHMAINHTDGILRSYDDVANSLPLELERCRHIEVASHDEIAPLLATILDVPTSELPKDLVVMGEIVCRMYCANHQPIDPKNRVSFLAWHNSASQIAVSAVLLFDDWRARRQVDKSIRGEKNPKRQIFRQLHAHYRKRKDEVERGDIVFSELTPGQFSFLTTRYSIANFALTSVFPAHEGAVAHLNVKRIKYDIQRSIYMKLLELSVAEAVRFADTLAHNVKQLVEGPRLRPFPTFKMSSTTVRWKQ